MGTIRDLHFLQGRNVAQMVVHSAVKVWILLHGGSIMPGGCVCNLGYFLLQPVIHKWSIKGSSKFCPVCGKVHIQNTLLFIIKSTLGGNSRFPLKKCVRITICLMSNSRCYENQCALEASLNKTNFLFTFHLTE